MSSPFFSIVIPTLNEAQFLPHLLNSLTYQTERDFEVLVVDGQSRDATVEKAMQFQEKLSLKILHSPEAQLSLLRNRGGKVALGQYLIFLDADTYLPPDFISQIHQIINSRKSVFLSVWLTADHTSFLDSTNSASRFPGY